MKQIIAAAFATVVAVPLLCSSPAVFAQDAASSPEQTQAALDMLKGMTPDQKQQMMQTGMDQVETMTPEQLKQAKDMYDHMTPEQKQMVDAQVTQQIEKDPKLKAKAEKKLDTLSPEQKKQLDLGQQ